jgi:hypothetical protein
MVRRALSQSLLHTLDKGEYVVDAQAVAEAILACTEGPAELPFASGVLVAAERRGILATGVDHRRPAAGGSLA